MEFIFETIYDLRATTAIARAIRKILRRKNSLLTRIFALIIFAVGAYFSSPLSGREFVLNIRNTISYLALLLIFVSVFFEDTLNGLIAQARLPRGDCYVDATFTEDQFRVGSENAAIAWQYQRIKYLAETRYYFIFIFSEHRAEIFEKDSLSGGAEEEFREFICKKTGKEFKKV